MNHLFLFTFIISTFDLASPVVQRQPTFASEFRASRMVCRKEKERKPFLVMAPVENKATLDICLSPYAGGEDLLLSDRILEKIETYCLGKSSLVYANTAYARFFRLSELIGIWLPINYFTMVVQHEVFGHGYRLRDLHTHNLAKVDGYLFSAPPPYGPGGAATAFSIATHITTTEGAAVSCGGVEGTAILALLTKLKWLSANRIDPRQSVLYLLSEQDLTLYISSLKLKENHEQLDHDINSYIKEVNYTYPEHLLSRGRLRSLSWINFADPFTFYAIYSWFHYLSSGKETKIPMIRSMYLPGFRLGLTPFGPEVFFENFFLRKKIPLYVYFAGGRHAGNTYLGLGTYAPKLWIIQKWSFGLRIDLWRQPKLLLQPGNVPYIDIDFKQKPSASTPLYPSSKQHAARPGASGSLITAYKANEWCSCEVELGYKSQGFLPGYSLFAFPTVRLNIGFVF